MQNDWKIAEPAIFELDENVQAGDVARIERLTQAVGVFRQEEVVIAGELVNDRLIGKDETYQFLFLRDADEQIIAYSCYGVICMTDERYDLYWIVVHPALQGKGIGSQLMAETLEHIAAAGGKAVYIETSSTAPYQPAQTLYQKHGFGLEARLKNFYREGDDKLIYTKFL